MKFKYTFLETVKINKVLMKCKEKRNEKWVDIVITDDTKARFGLGHEPELPNKYLVVQEHLP